MILPIVGYGDPVLRKVGEELTAEFPNLKETVANMYQTMYNACGVGLAAPQVGMSIRLFVIDTTAFGEDDELEENTIETSTEFSQEFNTEQLCRITKLSGLSGNIQIYPGKPIRFSSNIGSLGKISIYIKSKDQLENEQYNVESDNYDSE